LRRRRGNDGAVRLNDLEARVGYAFADASLLTLALTHVSAVGADSARGDSYQRLEFLGDRVLGLAVADMLYEAFPRAEEGELSRRLAGLVRRESCAEVALEWGVGEHVRLGEGEAQTGGRTKRAIVADVCEAIIGAVFLDGGYPAARHVVAKAWESHMRLPRMPLRDAKTALQEWAQARGLPPPAYAEIGRAGPAHAPEFRIAVAVPGFQTAEGGGTSKRAAEQAAAAAFLAREAEWSEPARSIA
jgi:ribonuclease-3